LAEHLASSDWGLSISYPSSQRSSCQMPFMHWRLGTAVELAWWVAWTEL